MMLLRLEEFGSKSNEKAQKTFFATRKTLTSRLENRKK